MLYILWFFVKQNLLLFMSKFDMFVLRLFMSIESDIFKKFKVDFTKLKQYGFHQKQTQWIFEKALMNGQFMAHLCVSEGGLLSGQVCDVDTGDEYVLLRMLGEMSPFVAELKKAYEDLLLDVRNQCFCRCLFSSNQANRVARFIQETYQGVPEFLWEKWPDYAIFRCVATGKWYALIAPVAYKSLAENQEGNVDILNVKIDKQLKNTLLQQKGFYPAYHMNKQTWITITLNDMVPDEKIFDLIQSSYQFSEKK